MRSVPAILAPVATILTAIANVFAPVTSIFTSIHTVFEPIPQPALVLRVADVFPGIASILTRVANVLPPVAAVFPSIPDVFQPIPPIVQSWPLRGERASNRQERENQGRDDDGAQSTHTRLHIRRCL